MTFNLEKLRAKLARWLCPEVFTERESLRSQCLRILSQRDKAEKDLADYRVRAKAEQQALEDEVQILITDKTKLEEQLRDLTKKVEKYKGYKVLYYNIRKNYKR